MDRIGPYRVLAELGRGGFATVFRVADPDGGPDRALKLLAAGREERRFVRELEALRRLVHPGIVRLRDMGRHRGRPYLVMDLVAGPTLAERLEREGPLAPRAAADLALALARALAAAHAAGLLHRDLKPQNVLLAPGGPRLADFGLVRDTAVPSSLSRTGQLLGTPGYLAPEQAKGRRDLDARADVFGLGAVLFASLTGEPPFGRGTLVELVQRTRRAPIRSPRALRPEVDAALERVCLRCLARDPEDRYPSAAALADDLARYLAGRSRRGRVGRGPLGAAAAGVIVGALGAGAIVAAGWADPPPDAGPRAASPAREPPAPRPTDPPGAPPTPAESPAGDPGRARAATLLTRGWSLVAPDDPTTWGAARAELHDVATRALATGVRQPEALVLRAMAAAVADRPAAVADCERAIALDPDLARAHAVLAVLVQAADPARAEAAASRALELDPALTIAWVARAEARRRAGDDPGALADLDAAIARRPLPWIVAARAGHLIGLGQLDEALADLEVALAADPDYAPALYRRGRVRAMRDRPREALPDLERAAALAPDNAGVQLALARTCVALGELGRARAQVDRLLRGAPTYPGALELDSELRRRRGDAAGALAAARRAVELRPDRFEAQLVLAKALAVAGDRAAARVALERAGALAPDDPDVAELRRSLAE